NSSTSVVSVIFTFDLYAARMIRCPAVGDVMKTNTIPNISLTLMVPSVNKKYKKAPTSVSSTARVELFVAACALLYTSVKRMMANALIALIIPTMNISNAPQNSFIAPALNQHTPIDKAGQRNRTHKSQNAQNEYHFQKSSRMKKSRDHCN